MYRKFKTGYIYRGLSSKFTSLSVVFKAGSIYDPKGRKGASHLMEHLICKSLDKYDERFSNDCITFNASTTFEYVEFYFRGLNTKLTDEFKQELVHTLLEGFNVTREEFETEKMVVLQEITDSFDDVYTGNLLNCLYGYYGYVDAGGFPDDVKAFTYEEAQQMWKDMFTMPIRIVEVAWKRNDFSWVKYNPDLPRAVPIRYKRSDKKILPVIESDKANVYCFSRTPVLYYDYTYMYIGLEMLLDGFKSPFVQEIRVKRGLTYDVSGDMQAIVNKCILWFYACTDKEHADELVNLFNSLFKNVRQYLTKERFDMVLNKLYTMKEIKYLLRWENTEQWVEKEHPRITTYLKDITFEKTVGIVEKYLCDIDISVF